MIRHLLIASWLGVCSAFFSPALAAPATFELAKIEAREHVYYDQNQGKSGDAYCGCDWRWAGRSGGLTDLSSCDYRIRLNKTRAERIEWEHVVPISVFGQSRQCWKNGGREQCGKQDTVFSAVEADLHNLLPSVGEVNGDRQNFPFGNVNRNQADYGSCDFKVDFQARLAEPRDEVKGMIARIYFYMHDRYNLPLSTQQQKLLLDWHQRFPVSAWERERDNRIAKRMGHHNPFVTGETQWTLGHQNSGKGLQTLATNAVAPRQNPTTQTPSSPAASTEGAIRGNRNSKIYHLPQGCPGYSDLSARNVIEFDSEEQAIAAGYRKAGNCR